jgi:hypothetical protein
MRHIKILVSPEMLKTAQSAMVTIDNNPIFLDAAGIDPAADIDQLGLVLVNAGLVPDSVDIADLAPGLGQVVDIAPDNIDMKLEKGN